MNILSAGSLHALESEIAKTYNYSTIATVPALGDANRWFVLKDGYVLSGLHILKRDDLYVFRTIAP